MITTKINLQKFKSAVSTIKINGVETECIIIPLQQNNLFKGEKGVYLNITHYPLKTKLDNEKVTHLVKQQIDKKVFDTLTDDEKKQIPILGNSVVYDLANNNTISIDSEYELNM